MAQSKRSRRLWAAYLALAAVALANAGCLVAAAAGAAGGVAGYAYYKGKVCRPYVANVADVHAATCKALQELQLPILKDEPGPKGGKIESRAGDDSVVITLELQDSPVPGQGPQTEVGVRVATFGNEGLSERILDQISFHLVPPGAVPVPPPLGPLQPPPAPAPQPAPALVPQSAAPPLAK
ncbi:MAG TPA: DUF3568 family protein [Gemmataceae bacterium]|nr:DUF3568 family protein [Gemmataceae bacterium]